MVVYADTSFVFSLYGQDANTALAADLAGQLGCPFLFTPLHRHELRNAVRLSIFRGDIDEAQAGRMLADIETDVTSGVLRGAVVRWDEVFKRGEMLSAEHTAAIGAGALDVLHVASALSLEIERFLTFDHRQVELAAKAGLRVEPGSDRATG